MPTQDNTLTTRTQFLRCRTIARDTSSKRKIPNASFQTDLTLGELCYVSKDMTGKTTEPGCGGGSGENDLILLDVQGLDFSTSGTRAVFSVISSYNPPTFSPRSTIRFQIINAFYIENISLAAFGNDVGQTYNFATATIATDPPYSGSIEYDGTSGIAIFNVPKSIGLTNSSIITLTLPFSITTLGVGFSNTQHK